MAFKYCKNNEASVFETVNAAGKGVKIIDKILLGSYITILGQNGNWFNTRAFGKTGWMNAADLTDEPALKVFYLDVGQGDGCLLEIDRFRMLIDAGAGDNMYNYLTKYHFKSLLNQGFPVHIDFLIVSHFDRDHFKGFAGDHQRPTLYVWRGVSRRDPKISG